MARSLRPSRTPRLAGLMSRWSTPARSSATSASSRSVPHRSSRSRDSRSRPRSTSPSVSSPALSSTRACRPPTSSGPSTSRTSLGSASPASTSASPAIRLAAASSLATLSTRMASGPELVHRQVRDQQADRGGPRAEAALQPEPAVDDRPGRGIQRVDDVLGRPGQGPFGLGQPLQERPDVRQPLAHRRPGGLQHQRAHRRRHLRQVRRQVEPVVPVQPLAQRRAVGRGRTAGQHVVGQGAEREHVEPDPVGIPVPHALGGLERLGQPPVHVHRARPHRRARLAAAVGRAHQAGHPAARQPGRRRPRDRARAAPVTHQHPQLAVGRPVHPDRVRRQPAVHDPVPVRVRHRLGHLPQQPQLRFRGNAARVVGQPQVEPLEPFVQRVDQADAELAVDHVPRAQQPVVRQPRHDPVLVLGDLADPGPLGRRRARRRDQEPDPAPVGRGHPVERRPVLPAVALAERLLVDHPRARLALAALHDPDPLHQRGDDLLPVDADRLLRRGRLEQPLGDPGQPGIAPRRPGRTGRSGTPAAAGSAAPDGAGTRTPARTARPCARRGPSAPVSCAQRISSSCSLLASRCALRRASFSGESSAR